MHYIRKCNCFGDPETENLSEEGEERISEICEEPESQEIGHPKGDQEAACLSGKES